MLKYATKIAVASLLCHLLFLIIFGLFHVLRPDKSACSSFTSEYAIGDDGWLLTLGFFAIATGGLFLIIGLLQHLTASKTSLIALSLWCVLILLVAVFKTDLPGSTPTPKGLIHGFAALLAFICIGIAMLSWGIIFKRDNSWNNLAIPSFVFGIASLLVFIIFLSSVWSTAVFVNERKIYLWKC